MAVFTVKGQFDLLPLNTLYVAIKNSSFYVPEFDRNGEGYE